MTPTTPYPSTPDGPGTGSLPTELETLTTGPAHALATHIRELRDADTRLTRRLENLLHLGPNDLAALQHVHEQSGATATVKAADLSTFLGVTSAAMTLLVGRLVKAGHLTRSPDPADKRAHTLHLTAPTRDALTRATESTRTEIDSLLGTLTARENKRATVLLSGFTAALNHGANTPLR